MAEEGESEKDRDADGARRKRPSAEDLSSAIREVSAQVTTDMFAIRSRLLELERRMEALERGQPKPPGARRAEKH